MAIVAEKVFSARRAGDMEMFAAQFVPFCGRLIWLHGDSFDSKHATENAAPYLKLPYACRLETGNYKA